MRGLVLMLSRLSTAIGVRVRVCSASSDLPIV
jgi:hypothetical protein